jgi:hypothetical protein
LRRLDKVGRVLRWLAAIVAIGQAIWTLYNFVSVHIFQFPIPSLTDVGQGALVTHAITVLFLIGAPSILPRFQQKSEFQDAVVASKQFALLWYFVWVLFFALYAIWSYYWAEISAGKESLPVHLAVDSLNLGTSALLFICYLAMVLRSVPDNHVAWFRVVFRVFIFVVAFIFTEGLTAKYFPDAPGTFGKQAYFDAFQGLLSGVGIALLVGRLESKLIDTSRWIVAALYAYAVLQFAYPILTVNNPEKSLTFLLLTSLALLLKVLLFWEFRRIITSGVLTYYMFEYRRLLDAGSTERDRVIKALKSG